MRESQDDTRMLEIEPMTARRRRRRRGVVMLRTVSTARLWHSCAAYSADNKAGPLNQQTFDSAALRAGLTAIQRQVLGNKPILCM